MKKCWHCSNDYDDDLEYCPVCGRPADRSSIDRTKANIKERRIHENSDNSDGQHGTTIIGMLKERTIIAVGTAMILLMFVFWAGCFFAGRTMNDHAVSGVSSDYSITAKEKATEETVAEEAAAAKKKAEEEAAAKKKAEEEAARRPAVSMSSIESINATSWKAEKEYDLYHRPENMVDGDLSTAWCEDVDGNGIGEIVYIQLDGEYTVSGLYIYPGYHKSRDLFEKNGTPTKISVTGDRSETFTLDDEMKRQKLTFSKPMRTDELVIEILKVRKGWKYADTLITDIKLF